MGMLINQSDQQPRTACVAYDNPFLKFRYFWELGLLQTSNTLILSSMINIKCNLQHHYYMLSDIKINYFFFFFFFFFFLSSSKLIITGGPVKGSSPPRTANVLRTIAKGLAKTAILADVVANSCNFKYSPKLNMITFLPFLHRLPFLPYPRHQQDSNH